jgi:hypothetical protein
VNLPSGLIELVRSYEAELTDTSSPAFWAARTALRNGLRLEPGSWYCLKPEESEVMVRVHNRKEILILGIGTAVITDWIYADPHTPHQFNMKPLSLRRSGRTLKRPFLQQAATHPAIIELSIDTFYNDQLTLINQADVGMLIETESIVSGGGLIDLVMNPEH